MDQLFRQIGNLAQQGIRQIEKNLWPGFRKKYLPEAVIIKLETLPQVIQEEYHTNYELQAGKHRHSRNVTLLVLGTLWFISGSWVFPVGGLIYLWHLKHRKIPEIAQNTLNDLLTRYNLKESPRKAAHLRTFHSTETPHRNRPRKIVEQYDPSNLSIENIKEGFLLDFDLKTWSVVSQFQFDWDIGITGREFKLVNDIENMLVYLFKEGNYLTVSINKQVNIFALDNQLETEILHQKRPKNIINYHEVEYFRENALEGFMFNRTEGVSGTRVHAWEYYDHARKNYLRIEQYEQKNFRAILGKLVSPYEFTEILPQKK